MGGNIQAAQHIHHGGLAGTGLAHYGHKFPPVDVQTDAVQGADLAFQALTVNFIYVFQFYQHITSRSFPSAPA